MLNMKNSVCRWAVKQRNNFTTPSEGFTLNKKDEHTVHPFFICSQLYFFTYLQSSLNDVCFSS